jgi:hypothetical protein
LTEYATLLKEYRVRTVTSGYYGAEWVAEFLGQSRRALRQEPASEAAIYLECVPLFTRGLVWPPDHSRLLRELRLLERHTHRSGKDTVDHPKGGHDDHANAVCGVLHELSRYLGYNTNYAEWVG